MSDKDDMKQNSSGEQGSYQLPKIVKKLQDRTVVVLSRLLSEMLDNADDAFYDMAEKALDQGEQTLYFDSMRELRIKRKGIEAKFKQAIKLSFDKLAPKPMNFGATLSEAEDLFHENLSLVHDEDLEENLAIDSMVNKARSRNSVTLKQLALRLSAVMSKEYDDEETPFDPQWACHAFADGCLSLDLDLKSRLLFYKLFDRNVVGQLSLLFNQANQYMLDQGILPELRTHTAKKQTASTQERSKQTVKEAFGSDATPDDDVLAPEVSSVGFENFMAFQKLVAQSSMSSYHVIPGAPMVVGKELISQLSELQKADAILQHDESSSLSTDELRQLLSTSTSLAKVPNFGREDSDVIDVVAMLFDFILDDKNLPVEIKALIGRLQIPVVKLAIMDKGFFSRQVHPARKLLNLLSKAGVGFSQQEKSSELLVKKIEGIVSRVLSEFTDNPQVFAELLVDFSKFLEGDEKRRNILERRVCEAEQGKAKSATARSRVQEVLAEMYDGNFIPVAVESLMEEAWERVMFLALTREGEDSQIWKNVTLTVKNLVKSVQKSGDSGAKAELAKILPLMLKDLKSGFESIGLDKLTSAKLLKGLAECHRATLTGKEVEGVWYGDVPEELKETAVIETVDEAGEVVDESAPEDAAPILEPVVAAEKEKASNDTNDAVDATSDMPTLLMDKVDVKPGSIRIKVRPRKVEVVTEKYEIPEGMEDYVKQVQAYESGTWFEVKVKTENVRCKLAAKIPATHKYLFVGRSGMKVAEYNDIELATLLKDGGIKVLDDSALFDRALESVITNLRQAQKSA